MKPTYWVAIFFLLDKNNYTYKPPNYFDKINLIIGNL